MSAVDLSTGYALKPEKQGIYIRHKVFKSLMLVVRDRSRQFTDPPPPYVRPTCRYCGYQHRCKTYHFQLDDNGGVLVSEGVLKSLRRLDDLAGFEIQSATDKPPDQTIKPVRIDLNAHAKNPEPIRVEKAHAN